MKVTWNGKVLAESKETKIVEGNYYYPPSSINKEYFKESDHRTTCVWKGVASYFTLQDGNKVLENGAWYYPNPSKEADRIKGYVAFDPQVTKSQ